jgi:hypothetical protein
MAKARERREEPEYTFAVRSVKGTFIERPARGGPLFVHNDKGEDERYVPFIWEAGTEGSDAPPTYTGPAFETGEAALENVRSHMRRNLIKAKRLD